MAKIVVNTRQLDEYGNKLYSQSETFGKITSKMDEIITSLSNGWNGTDAKTFISNATEYLNNLKTIEVALANYGQLVKDCSQKYQDRINRFYED